MEETFEVVYFVEDGYVTGDRPKYVEIHLDEIDGSMTDDDLTEMFYEIVREDFEQKVTFEVKQGYLESFLEKASEYRDHLKNND